MKKDILFIVFICCISSVYAQKKPPTDSLKGILADEQKKYIPTFSPLSPNASGLQQYGNYPVNMATGLANISIPIYTAQNGKLSLPITLRYHPSGHRIDELASWVGWGWSLDIGAFLGRSIHGLADDKPIATNYLNTNILSWNLCNNQQDYTNANLVNDDQYDIEPDLFSYATPEESGKFYLRQSGQSPFLIPFQPVKISHDYLYQNQLKTFRIVSPSGNEYVFGRDLNNQDATEYQSVLATSGNYVSNGVVAWHLTKILSPNTDDAIFCSYQDGGYTNQSNYSWSAAATFYNGTPVDYSALPQFSKQSRQNTQKNIHKITFTNGEIEFIQSTVSEPRLDQANSNFLKTINVYNYENSIKTLLKKFDFEYSYFTDRTGASGRLKLNKIIERNQNSTESLAYSFDYFTNSYSWKNDINGGDLNLEDLTKQDYFGYFNGKNNAHLIDIASYNGVVISGGIADRSTVETYMKEGVLSKITYPTGGFTNFDFEANKYKQIGVEKLAGGLRIKSIQNYKSTGNLASSKRYEYGSDDGIGVGKLTNLWSSPSTGKVGSINNLVAIGELDSHIHQTDFIGSNGMAEMNSFEGTPLYYTTVKEFAEMAGAVNGYTAYGFSFEPDINVTNQNAFVRDIEPWKRGLLDTKKTYDSSGVLVEETSNTYQEFRQEYITNVAKVNLINNTLQPCSTCTSSMPTTFWADNGNNSCPYPKYNYFTGNNKTGQMKLISSVSSLDNVSSSQSVVYNDDLFPKTIETSESYTNEKRIQESIFATDAIYDYDANALAMRTRNMINIPLESIEKVNLNGIISTIFNQKTLYSFIAGNNARELTQNILPKEIWISPAGASIEKRVDFVEYDGLGNPKEYVVDELPNSLVWGYGASSVLGILNNATNSQANTALQNAGITENAFSVYELSVGQLSQLNNLQNSLPNSPVSWFTHRPMVGMVQNLGAEGIKTPYVFDNFQRLHLIKDHDLSITNKYAYSYATTAPSSCTTPSAPSISASSTTLCNVNLSATGCAGIINWSNGQSGNTITLTTANTITITATCSVGTCTSTASNALILPVLPTSWQAIDIGSSTVNGCTNYNSSVLTMQSDGPNNSIGGADSDKFHFVYKTYSGDVSVITKLTGMTAGDGNRSGIMIRNSLDPKSVMFSIIQDNNAYTGKLLRNTDNADSHLWQFNNAVLNATWLRLDKVGNSVTARFSTLANPNPAIASDWQEMTGNTGNPAPSMTWNGTFYLGFATMAYPAGSNNTIFTNTSVNGSTF